MLSFISSDPLLSTCVAGIVIYVIAGGYHAYRLFRAAEKAARAQAFAETLVRVKA